MLPTELKHTIGHLLSSRRFQHTIALAALTAFSLLLFFYHADQRALWSSHEGRAGQHAQLMLDTGRWGMPTLYYGEADYQKPPLYYWMVAGVAATRGGIVDAWSIRTPAAAAALAGVWLIYAVGATLWRPQTGVVAALILASNLRYSWLARVGRIDMPLTLAVSIALICFYAAYRATSPGGTPMRKSHAWRWMLPAYLAVAIAVMLKGPIGLVLTGIPVVLFLSRERQSIWPWQRGFGDLAHRLGAWWGIPLVLLVAAPWFVWATVVTHGDFFKTFFLHHNLDRTLGAEGLKPEPIWYYVPRIIIDLYPWSLVLPAAIWTAARRTDGDAGMASRFALCSMGGMFVFLSLVRFKRHDYLLPLLPSSAILLASYWDRLFEARPAATDWRWARALGWLAFTTVCASGAGLVCLRNENLADRVLDSSVVDRLVQQTDRMVLRQLRASLAESSGAITFVAFGIVTAGVCALVLVYARRPLASAACVALTWLAGFLFYVDNVLPPLEPLREQVTLAELAHRVGPADATLFYYGREDQQLMFYLGPGTRWLPNRTALRPLITGTEPVFVVMELERLQIRQKEWPDVFMVPIARNTDSSLGEHRNPAALVTNAAGWEFVRSQRIQSGLLAN